MDWYLYLFTSLLSVFFPFLWQNVNITGSKCAIADCNLSEKQKLALSQTQSGEPNTIGLATWLLHMLCNFMTVTSRSCRLPGIYHENRSSWCIYVFGKNPTSIFSLHFRYTYFLLYILPSQSWLTRKYVLFPFLGIYLSYVIDYLIWTLGRIWCIFHKLNFQH